MPETASRSASLTPLHWAGRDRRFSKLFALKNYLWQKKGRYCSVLPDRDALDPPHAILISVNCVENIGVFLKALLLLQLEEMLFPGYSTIAEI